MRLARHLNKILSVVNLKVTRLAPSLYPVYDRDGLRSEHNHEFIDDPAFVAAYRRGVRAVGDTYRIEWRLHTALWAASCARKLEGDFVECGVNRGFMSSAIMHYLDWNSCDRTFYLCDTFQGLDPRFVSDEDKMGGALETNEKWLRNGFYTTNFDGVRKNFAKWRNVRFIVGSIPETLPQIDAKRVAYLHLDLNCSPPEVATLDYLWARLSPGAIVLLDDYAYRGYAAQKHAMDAFAAKIGVSVLSLPTGQGLIVKS